MNTSCKFTTSGLLIAIFLSGCATQPVGPSLTVMPAPGKPFDIFQNEDQECRAYAQGSLGTTADDEAAKSTAKTAVIGATLGALAGAMAQGGKSKNVGTGAAVGMLGGAVIGATQGSNTGREVQRRYDIAYQQCMYSKGNQVPGYAIQKPLSSPAPAKR